MKGLPPSCDKNKLLHIFQPFNVDKAYILYDHKTGASRGFGFVEFFSEESLLRAIDKPIYVEGKAIKCSRAFLKQDAVKQTTCYQEQQKVTTSQKTTDGSKGSPDSSFDMGQSQHTKQPKNSSFKQKSKVRNITVAETQSHREEPREGENSLSLGNPSPTTQKPARDPWSLNSPVPHRDSFDYAYGLNQCNWEDPSPTQIFSECNSFQGVHHYAPGDYHDYYQQCYAQPQTRFNYHHQALPAQFPGTNIQGYPCEQSTGPISSRTGGVIGQRLRGFSENEAADCQASQWLAPGPRMHPGAFHHQGYSSFGWQQPEPEQSLANRSGCQRASAQQRTGHTGKPSSTYRMF